jgi:hypothetical protein
MISLLHQIFTAHNLIPAIQRLTQIGIATFKELIQSIFKI